MDYRECPPPAALSGLVKCFWTLAAGGEADHWITHCATPDGCVEIIRRVAGRSRWDGDQPEAFAVGLSAAPTAFEIRADSRFVGARLWPWAWSPLGEAPLATMLGHWRAVEDPTLAGSSIAESEAVLIDRLADAGDLAAIGRALLGAGSVEEMGRMTGMTPRALQRWFARHVGMPARRYLRLLRFQRAFEQVHAERTLADHAAVQGFADQAHMAREFREMAGAPATLARKTARGPFLT